MEKVLDDRTDIRELKSTFFAQHRFETPDDEKFVVMKADGTLEEVERVSGVLAEGAAARRANKERPPPVVSMDGDGLEYCDEYDDACEEMG